MSAKKHAMEVDLTERFEAEVPVLRDLAKNGHLQQAIEGLFALEKITRQGGDFATCKRVARELVKICHENNDFSQLTNALIVLSKRRGQENAVVQVAVQETMAILDTVQEDVKVNLVDTLRSITEGKIFVEIERAQLTRILARMRENEGKLKEAAQILQEIQVETLGKMEKAEKIEFILEQMRLCLDCGDFSRANVLSRKINTNVLASDDTQELKLNYHRLMIRYYSHVRDFLQICHSFQQIYNTPSVKSNGTQSLQILKMIAVYIVLSPDGPEQRDLLLRVFEDKQLSDLAAFKALLKYFFTMELIRWPSFREIYDPLLSPLQPFIEDAKLWEDLQLRVTEHNIRVIAAAYSRITAARFSELLDLSLEEAERRISDMIVRKAIAGQIDRPAGIISFIPQRQPAELLNEWSQSISSLLGLVEKTCLLIQRETMIHSTKIALANSAQ